MVIELNIGSGGKTLSTVTQSGEEIQRVSTVVLSGQVTATVGDGTLIDRRDVDGTVGTTNGYPLFATDQLDRAGLVNLSDLGAVLMSEQESYGSLILAELKKINFQLALITNTQVNDNEVI